MIDTLDTGRRSGGGTLLNVHQRGSDGRVAIAATLDRPADLSA